MSNLNKAISIAASAHDGQFQKNGLPYILHPIHVMNSVNKLNEKIVAILHDVVEDTEVTIEQLKTEGFSIEITEAISLLTKTEGTEYKSYIENIKSNELAKAVKLADMKHNIDSLRLNELKDYDLKRIQKYHSSIKFLESE